MQNKPILSRADFRMLCQYFYWLIVFILISNVVLSFFVDGWVLIIPVGANILILLIFVWLITGNSFEASISDKGAIFKCIASNVKENQPLPKIEEEDLSNG